MSVESEGTEDKRIRLGIIENAFWGIDNGYEIHYSQTRPIDGINTYRKLPLSTDCSGFVTLCYQWAGAADPNGQGFSGYGYTGTILDHCTLIDPHDARTGDLAVFGPATGDHVVVLFGDGGDDDNVVISHGQEKGPSLSTLGRQAASHRPPVRFVRCPDLTDPGAQRHLDLTTENEDLRAMANAPSET